MTELEKLELETKFVEFSEKVRNLLKEYPEFETNFMLVNTKDHESSFIDSNDCIPCVKDFIESLIEKDNLQHIIPENIRRGLERAN